MREIITLQCSDCKNRNYSTTKNKKKNQDRLELKKFCCTCRHHITVLRKDLRHAELFTEYRFYHIVTRHLSLVIGPVFVAEIL